MQWVASFMLAICGLPLLFDAIKRKRTDVSWAFLALWGAGEIGLFAHVLREYQDAALLLNYGGNLAIVLALVWYRSAAYRFPNA